MRFYARTSRNTGVSFGWVGAAILALGCLMLLAVPVYVIQWAFHHWYTAPIGVLVIALALLVLLGSIVKTTRR